LFIFQTSTGGRNDVVSSCLKYLLNEVNHSTARSYMYAIWIDNAASDNNYYVFSIFWNGYVIVLVEFIFQDLGLQRKRQLLLLLIIIRLECIRGESCKYTGTKTVFTRSVTTPPKVNQFGWNV